jgi:hypothetical protein
MRMFLGCGGWFCVEECKSERGQINFARDAALRKYGCSFAEQPFKFHVFWDFMLLVSQENVPAQCGMKWPHAFWLGFDLWRGSNRIMVAGPG